MRRKPTSSHPARPVQYWPSHTRFDDLIGYCVRGSSQPGFACPHCGDHIAETCELFMDDTDAYFWARDLKDDGVVVRRIFEKLEKRAWRDKDLRAAEILYAIATEACRSVLGLYLRHRALFDQIAPRRNFLPSLFSVHPNTAKVVAEMFAASKLGSTTRDAQVAGSRAYYVSDSPANVYARAIVHAVISNRNLVPICCQQQQWRAFDRKEGVRTVILPFPKYVEGLGLLPPLSPASVMDYWRKGKEIIREEMPEFHLRPEWASYHGRSYTTGAKAGAVQNAIFKDILIALRTIAGANQRLPAPKKVTR